MNKPHLSVITTSPEAQPSKIGMPAGALGLARRVRMDELPAHPDPELARHMMGCLQAFNGQPCESDEDRDLTSEAIHYLRTPAPRKWIAGRVVSLLSHYFVAQTDEGVAGAVAEDWCAMLDEFPAWALANACRWWMSHENPRKHFKPLPGDIQERAHFEMRWVKSASVAVLSNLRPAHMTLASAPAEQPRYVTESDREHRKRVADEIMAGFLRKPAPDLQIVPSDSEEA